MWWHSNWWTILIVILALPVVASVAFALWLRRRENVDLETGAKCWDAFSKLIGALTVIVSGAMLFGKYIEQQASIQSAQAMQAVHDAKLQQAEFLRQKLEFDEARHERKRVLFDETKDLVAHLAKSNDLDPASVSRFDQLFLGGLIGVEELGGPVEIAMVRFEKKLRDKDDAPTENLHRLSLELSRACEKELKDSEEDLLNQHSRIAKLVTFPLSQE